MNKTRAFSNGSKLGKTASAIFIAIISAVMSYLIINHYTATKLIVNKPEIVQQAQKEVNVYIVLDQEHYSKIIQDDIASRCVTSKCMDLTKTSREPIPQLI